MSFTLTLLDFGCRGADGLGGCLDAETGAGDFCLSGGREVGSGVCVGSTGAALSLAGAVVFSATDLTLVRILCSRPVSTAEKSDDDPDPAAFWELGWEEGAGGWEGTGSAAATELGVAGCSFKPSSDSCW